MYNKSQRQIQCSYKKLSTTISTICDTPTTITESQISQSCELSSTCKPKLKQSLLKPLSVPKVPRLIPNPYESPKSTSVPNVENENVPYSRSIQATLSVKHELDTKWIGHQMRKPLPSHARIWIQNVHGLNISNNFNPYLEHLIFIKRYNIQFLALTETHLNPSNMYVRENIEASHKMIYPESHVVLTNTPTSNNDTTRQSGGILSSTQGRLSSRFAGSGQDPGGRFTWMDFYGKSIYLRIYTVYRVCNNSDKQAGDNQAWTLQREWLLQRGVQVNPRTQILRALQKSIRDDILKNGKFLSSVILMKMCLVRKAKL